jgi:hypothetical protein
MSNFVLRPSRIPSEFLLAGILTLGGACGDDGGDNGTETSTATTSGTETSASGESGSESSASAGSESNTGDGDGDGNTGDGDGDGSTGDGDGSTGDGDGSTGDGDGSTGDGDGSTGDGDGSTGDGDGSTGDGDGSTGDGSTGDGDGSTGDGDGSTGDGDGSTGDGDGDACDKVDILFVIDHSGSMAEEQSALLSAFPDFANAMIATLDTVTSLHVGVAATGPFSANDPASCAVNGALVAQPPCLPFADGNRFITESDDIAGAFNCNASLGTTGPGDNNAMFNVVSSISTMNQPGECNADFLRDDALLVVVIITDEEDDHDNPPGFGYPGSPGDPADWVADVVAAKDGIETNVVIASFVQPPEPNACPAGNNGSFQVWYEANRIIEFTNSFTNSVVHDICDTAGFQDGFDEALAFIDTACDQFQPPE